MDLTAASFSDRDSGISAPRLRQSCLEGQDGRCIARIMRLARLSARHERQTQAQVLADRKVRTMNDELTKDMSETKRRRWFQIHLFTAIVLMFVCGGIIGKNISSRNFVFAYEGPTPAAEKLVIRSYWWGWPEVLFWGDETIPYKDVDNFNVEGVRVGPIQWGGLLIDISTALGLLCGSIVACEFAIRRREARKT